MDPTLFSPVGENWMITPAALAVDERQSANIALQHWLLVLSGVCIIDLHGNNPDDWRRETITIRPDVFTPIDFVINRHSISVPPGMVPAFNVDQWVPYAATSSIFAKDTSDEGFAVDLWRPTPFGVGTDANGNEVAQVFEGIDVDVAVRNDRAILHRVSFHIDLLGRIAFVPQME
jgi:hypothetical protein